MSKKIKKNNGVFYVVISLVAVFALVSSAVAYSVNQVQNIENYYEAESSSETEGPSFGAQAGTDLTVDNLTYGASRSVRLTFAQGATSTPGGLFEIANYGLAKVCTRIEVDISSAQSTGGLLDTGFPLSFSVGTSTIGTLENLSNLIATTTVATTSATILDTTTHKGTGVNAAGQNFVWERGDSIIGQYDILAGSPATSTAYGAVGNVYVTCHERN